MPLYLEHSQKSPAYWKIPPAGEGYYLPRGLHPFQWGHLNTIMFLLDLGKAWASLGTGRLMGIGDISIEGGGDNHGAHKGHRYGVEVDIYACRKDAFPLPWPGNQVSCVGKPVPGDIYEDYEYNDPNYDPDATTRLAETILGSPYARQQVVFNDVPIRKKYPSIQNRPLHDDHIHVTLVPRNYSKDEIERMGVVEAYSLFTSPVLERIFGR